MRILITGASNLISYVLIRELAKGVFGKDQEIVLVLLDKEPMLNVLKGFVMEIKDCLLPLIQSVEITTDLNKAFVGVDLVIFTDSEAKQLDNCLGLEDEGMQKILTSAQLFVKYSKYINAYAKFSVKLFVVSEPTYLNAYVLSKYTNVVQIHNIVCFSRLNVNKFISHIWKTNSIKSDNLRNIFAWGYKNEDLLPDVTLAVVKNLGIWQRWNSIIVDTRFVKNFFSKLKINNDMKFQKFYAISTCKAICDQLRDWWQGTYQDDVVTMCVASDGSYDIPRGIFWNFPVTIKDERIRIYNQLELDIMTRDFIEEEMVKCLKEMNNVFSDKSFKDDFQNLKIDFTECT